jgi:hypothetical protein
MRVPIHLVNLHGYLAWLWDPEEDRYWKFELGDLRGPVHGRNYWQALRDGTAAMFPLVVLTDRKEPAIAESRYSLAYGVFEQRLTFADRWLIAGYSFQDRPVRASMERALASRRALRENDPKLVDPQILVLSRCTDIEAAELRGRLSGELQLNDELVVVEGSGLPDSTASPAWEKWAE